MHKLHGKKTASGCAVVGSEDHCWAMTSSPVPVSQSREAVLSAPPDLSCLGSTEETR